MEVVVRPAVDDDVAAIRAIGQATWPETYRFAGDEYVEHGLDAWWSDAAVRASIETTHMLVGTIADRVVGTGNVDLRPETPVIWRLYVLPEFQGYGMGSALLDRLIEAVPPDRGSVQIEYVAGNDRAAAVYQRHGFAVVRREPGERPQWPDQVWAERSLTHR